MLEGKKSVLLMRCTVCPETALSGSLEKIDEIQKMLEENGIEVTATVGVESACHTGLTKRELKGSKEALEKAEAVVGVACGAGVQAISLSFPDKPVYPALDSMFLGNIQRFGRFEQFCSLCGECILDKTGGLCPLTTCAKGILNGPCGGVNNGKCEVSSEIDCGWIKIHERLAKIGESEKSKKTLPPKNFSAAQKPLRVYIERKPQRAKGK